MAAYHFFTAALPPQVRGGGGRPARDFQNVSSCRPEEERAAGRRPHTMLLPPRWVASSVVARLTHSVPNRSPDASPIRPQHSSGPRRGWTARLRSGRRDLRPRRLRFDRRGSLTGRLTGCAHGTADGAVRGDAGGHCSRRRAHSGTSACTPVPVYAPHRLKAFTDPSHQGHNPTKNPRT